MKKVFCVVIELDDYERAEDVIARIKSSCETTKICDIQQLEVTSFAWRAQLKMLMNNLGESTSTMGYNTLFDIMEAVEKNPEYQERCMLKQLYSYVTKKTGRPYIQLERNIRTMIERIYDNNPTEYVHNILGIPEDSNIKITNKKFIALLIEKLF